MTWDSEVSFIGVASCKVGEDCAFAVAVVGVVLQGLLRAVGAVGAPRAIPGAKPLEESFELLVPVQRFVEPGLGVEGIAAGSVDTG